MYQTGSMTQSWVFRIIIANVAIYFIQGLTAQYGVIYPFIIDGQITNNQMSAMTFYLGLTPGVIIQEGYVWQFFSYMFLHGGFFHIFLNMYALLIFGIPIEQTWGSKKFVIYYIFTGVGAGITIFVVNLFLSSTAYAIPTIGASGAVFGLLLAFGLLFPEAELLIFFFLPIKAKYLVILYGALELYSLYTSGGEGSISHSGHLGGLLFGIIYFVAMRKHAIKFKSKTGFARLAKKATEIVPPDRYERTERGKTLLKILEKLKIEGPDSITDDEFQLIRYAEIMKDTDDEDICIPDDFKESDDYCKKCEDYETCVLREIKRYMQ